MVMVLCGVFERVMGSCLLSSGRYKHFQNSHLLLFASFLFNLGVMKANPALLAFVSEELGGTLEVMLIVL